MQMWRYERNLLVITVTLVTLALQDVIAIGVGRIRRQSDDVDDLGLIQVNVNLPASGKVPGRYMVELKENSGTDGIRALGLRLGRGQLRGARIRSTAKVGGFSSAVIDADESQLSAVRRSSEVVQVEPIVYVTKQQEAGTCSSQSNPPWNLDRIDQERANRLDGSYNYASSDGEGVVVYVLDTGIETTNVDFGNRAEKGTSFCMGCDNIDGCPSQCGDTDGDGHGTHVAGIIASNTYGVAKRATVVGVKILNDEGVGTSEDVINALRWVLRDVRKRGKQCKAVVNMSIGGPKSNIENRATDSLVKEGIPVIVASGNEGIDACLTSPSSARGSVTVGSVGRNDRRSSFSNWGKCVNLLAPGERIASLRNRVRGAVAYSGTSMAAPHVTGAAAIFLSRKQQGGCSGIKTWLSDNGVKGTVRGIRGERNLVLSVPCQTTASTGNGNNNSNNNNNNNVNTPTTSTRRPTTRRPTTTRPQRDSLLDFLSELFGRQNGGGNNNGGRRGWLFGK